MPHKDGFNKTLGDSAMWKSKGRGHWQLKQDGIFAILSEKLGNCMYQKGGIGACHAKRYAKSGKRPANTGRKREPCGFPFQTVSADSRDRLYVP